MVTKEQVLADIRRLAAENGGKAPGERKFTKETGIGRMEWFGRYWSRWGDALVEAGFPANVFRVQKDDEEALRRIAAFIRTLGHYPVWGEFLIEHRRDSAFPTSRIIKRLGNKRTLATRLIAYCETHGGMDEVKALCLPASLVPDAPTEDRTEDDESGWGFVYLFKSGRYYKLGMTVHVGQRERQFQIQLPDKPSLIHQIRTDDPRGIEAYWHNRFEARRIRPGAEFFKLTPEDLRAFKRRKGFM
jgi:hypothetical protein